jgi:hypothetical protein
MDLQVCILIGLRTVKFVPLWKGTLLLGEAMPVWRRKSGKYGASAQFFCDSKTVVNNQGNIKR